MKRICLFITVLLIFASCENLLDESPRHTATHSVFWKNEKHLDYALNGMYALLRRSVEGDKSNAWGYYWMYGDLRNGLWTTPNEDGDWLALFEGNLRKSALVALQRWLIFYRTVEQCNQIIDNAANVPGVSDEKLNSVLAQARYVRALTHFWVTRVWGDAPVNFKSENIEPLGRTPKEEVWDLLTSELKEIIPQLPVSYTNSSTGQIDKKRSKGFANRAAGWALLADIAMWQKDYQQVVEAIDEIDQMNKYRLLSLNEFRDLFDKGLTDEGIFEIIYDKDNDDYIGYYGTIIEWFLVRPYTDRTRISIHVRKEVIDQYYYDRDDARRNEFFQSIENIDDDNVEPTILPSIDEGDNSNTIVAKFRPPLDEPVFATRKYFNNILVYRLGILYLMRAEAKVQLDDIQGAMADLNRVRSRSLMSDFAAADKELILNEIIQEYFREGIGEGRHFYVLMRNHRIAEISPYINQQDEDKGIAYWPVHDEAFRQNPNMTQNEYWK